MANSESMLSWMKTLMIYSNKAMVPSISWGLWISDPGLSAREYNKEKILIPLNKAESCVDGICVDGRPFHQIREENIPCCTKRFPLRLVFKSISKSPRRRKKNFPKISKPILVHLRPQLTWNIVMHLVSEQVHTDIIENTSIREVLVAITRTYFGCRRFPQTRIRAPRTSTVLLAFM